MTGGAEGDGQQTERGSGPVGVQVRLLGAFEVRVAGEAVPAAQLRPRRAGELIKRLALAPRHRLSQDQLIEDLQPQLPSRWSRAEFYKTVNAARKALEPARPGDTSPRLQRVGAEVVLG